MSATGIPAAGEVGVAVALLRARLQGAQLSVEINLAELRDATYTADVAAEVARLAADAEKAAAPD